MNHDLGMRLASAHFYTMRELNEQTADVIRDVNERGEPAVITRQGRVVAVISPVGDGVESALIRAALQEDPGSSPTLGLGPGSDAYTPDEVAERLDLHVPRS